MGSSPTPGTRFSFLQELIVVAAIRHKLKMSSRFLITGFGPFAGVEHNPSGVLATAIDPSAPVLEVSYEWVSAFCRSDRVVESDLILCLGVNARASEIRYELIAHNEVGVQPGVDGNSWPGKEIVAGSPALLASTLVPMDRIKDLPIAVNHDAGRYLCNFILYQLLHLYPTKRVAFVHVPRSEAISFEDQMASLSNFLGWANLWVNSA